ncbi:isochorismatase hydrolase [Methylorubrum extorquens]|uniref:Isochorismatase hydrolase n=1 Tax=Methylorubrum extorquens (strain CM4 / NCIMB 13688) TaxID=440085 RepID=B7L1D4_METC4|nr:isochorismatase hydrolase [Methylorubrum extorquens]ACK81028.1 isochorismatase hydrolase [Methylorubrum extorquens CM4]
MSTPYNRLDLDQAVVLLLDHQAGLMSLVCDIEPDKFRNNVLTVADLAAYFQLPTILTTSFEESPNGPIMPELKAKFPNAPIIARPGQINVWDNSDFLAAVKAARWQAPGPHDRVHAWLISTPPSANSSRSTSSLMMM